MADARPGVGEDEAPGSGIPTADLHDLVIGIGNPLRGDDAVGAWLAERVVSTDAAVRVLVVQQLTPELAQTLAASRRVLFIDAWRPPGPAAVPSVDPAAPARRHDVPPSAGTVAAIQPRLRRLSRTAATLEAGAFSHVLDPAQLLAITTLLYGRAPRAWQLLVPAFRLGHGSGLSAELRRLLPQGQTLLRQWCEGRETLSLRPDSPNLESGPRHA